MNSKSTTILLLIILSGTSTLYGFYLILNFHQVVIGGSNTPSMIPVAVNEEPYFLVPFAIGIMGWLTTIYEVFSLDRIKITGSLRRRMLNEGFDRSVYRILLGRGGDRRIAIMQALNTPKIRNEIANITNTDWKEVDRNVRILESLNLVKIQFSHGSLSVYDLTESGKELMSIIRSQVGKGTSRITAFNP